MAFTNFYIGGGTDLNAGSTSADAGGSNAPSFTYAGGTYNRSTGVFTVGSGNPLTDGVAVNDWVSIYTTVGAVAATFVAKCTARAATTITVSTTVVLGLGTAVSQASFATTAVVGGAWASELVLGATGLGTYTSAISTKVNIKSGTYTVGANRTVSMAGATTAPLWFSGYNTTPGDLDDDTTNALTKPLLSVSSTFFLTLSGAFQTWTGLNIVGTRTGTIVTATGANLKWQRCRIENTSSNAGAIAAAFSGAGSVIAYSWFKTPTTATSNGVVQFATSVSTTVDGCVAEGGGLCGFDTTAQLMMRRCVGLNNTGSAFRSSTGALMLFNCTAHNPTADGVRWTGTPGAGSMVVACLLSVCGGYGINNASGANTNLVYRSSNDFYSCTSGAENGFGDAPAFFGQTDTAAVVASATDLTPVFGSAARAHGFPGSFETMTFSGGADIGAVQHPDVIANAQYQLGM